MSWSLRVQQLAQEGAELSLGGDIWTVLDRRSAAGFASPSGPARGGGAVFDQLAAAYTTGRGITSTRN